nr:MAG TPA: hypothetical protein [Bacteriophage sp.]
MCYFQRLFFSSETSFILGNVHSPFANFSAIVLACFGFF